MEPSPETIEVATRSWFAAARLLWMRRYPHRECPIPDFLDLDEEGQMFFRTVTRRTLVSADPENVRKIVERWTESPG